MPGKRKYFFAQHFVLTADLLRKAKDKKQRTAPNSDPQLAKVNSVKYLKCLKEKRLEIFYALNCITTIISQLTNKQSPKDYPV